MRLKHLLSVFLTLLTLSVGQVWGADETITLVPKTSPTGLSWGTNPGSTQGDFEFTSTDNAITVSGTEAKVTANYLNIYASGTMTFASSCKIKSIVIYTTTNGTSKTRTITLTSGGGALTGNSVSNNVASVTTNSGSNTPEQVTWSYSTGSTSVTFTIGTGQTYFYRFDVTYEPAAPATPYKVTFYKTDGSTQEITETSVGAGVTPPSMKATCGDWTFQGWSKSQSNSTTSTTVLSTETLLNGKYYPTAATTLYPVYTMTGSLAFSHYEKVTTAPTDWTAHKYVYATADNGRVMTGKSGNNTYGGYATMSTTTEMADYEITVATTSTSGRYKITQGGKYITCTSTGNLNWVNSYTAATSSINNCDWQFYLSSGAYRIEIPFKVSNNWYYINYNSSNPRFNTYTNQTAAFLYKRVEAAPTYYYSYPSCCDELGSINGSFS